MAVTSAKFTDYRTAAPMPSNFDNFATLANAGFMGMVNRKKENKATADSQMIAAFPTLAAHNMIAPTQAPQPGQKSNAFQFGNAWWQPQNQPAGPGAISSYSDLLNYYKATGVMTKNQAYEQAQNILANDARFFQLDSLGKAQEIDNLATQIMSQSNGAAPGGVSTGAGGKMLKVRLKKSVGGVKAGMTGSIPVSEFDDKLYDKI